MKRTEEIVIPLKLPVYDDKKTHAKTAAFPFQFPSGHNGVVMVCRLSREGWEPSEDIEKIVIHYHENTTNN